MRTMIPTSMVAAAALVLGSPAVPSAETAATTPAPAATRARLTREQLEASFDEIARRDGWDLTQPMLWGYFFSSRDPEPLERAAAKLSKLGYEVVGIQPGAKTTSFAPDTWWLRVEKIEVHSVDSLDARNQELYRFAEENGLEAYEGSDVALPPR